MKKKRKATMPKRGFGRRTSESAQEGKKKKHWVRYLGKNKTHTQTPKKKKAQLFESFASSPFFFLAAEDAVDRLLRFNTTEAT